MVTTDIDLSRNAFIERVDKASTSDRKEIADALTAMAIEAAARAMYAEERYGYGCGDQGHTKAAKKAQRTMVAIRKAMGFTYPKKGAYFA